MKISKLRDLGILVTVAALAGCGGGSGGGDNSLLQGHFIDAPVSGLGYETDTSKISGVTDATGAYNFKKGDNVTFFIKGGIPDGKTSFGRAILGKTKASTAPVTPITLATGTTDRVATATNIAWTLQNLNTADSGDTIMLPEDTKPSVSKIDGLKFDQSTSTFKDDAGANHRVDLTKVDKDDAYTNMQASIDQADGIDFKNTTWDEVSYHPACTNLGPQYETFTFSDTAVTGTGDKRYNGPDDMGNCTTTPMDPETRAYKDIATDELGWFGCLTPNGSCTLSELNNSYTYTDTYGDGQGNNKTQNTAQTVSYQANSGQIKESHSATDSVSHASLPGATVNSTLYRHVKLNFNGLSWTDVQTSSSCPGIEVEVTATFGSTGITLSGDQLKEGSCKAEPIAAEEAFIEYKSIKTFGSCMPSSCYYKDMNVNGSGLDDENDTEEDSLVLTNISDVDGNGNIVPEGTLIFHTTHTNSKTFTDTLTR